MAEETTKSTEQAETPKTESASTTTRPASRPASRPTFRPEQSRSSKPSYGQGQSRRRQQGGGRYAPKRSRVCSFCVDKIDYIDYKKPELLSSYITAHGKIYSRRRTGTCARHQRFLARALKRARFLALLPYTTDQIRLYGSGGSQRES